MHTHVHFNGEILYKPRALQDVVQGAEPQVLGSCSSAAAPLPSCSFPRHFVRNGRFDSSREEESSHRGAAPAHSVSLPRSTETTAAGQTQGRGSRSSCCSISHCSSQVTPQLQWLFWASTAPRHRWYLFCNTPCGETSKMI